MFDFDASKLLIIGVVALIVIGPKDLPRVLRQVGQMVGKLRRMAGEFQGQFMDAMKEADLEDLKNEVNKLKDTAVLDTDFNPVHDVKSELTKAVDNAAVPFVASAANPFAQNIGGVGLAGPAETPRLASSAADVAPMPFVQDPPAAGPMSQETGVLESAEPAHHTPAVSAGAVDAVAPSDSYAPEAAGFERRPRRVIVPKRPQPGDRVTRMGPVVAGRGRTFLPPRHDPKR